MEKVILLIVPEFPPSMAIGGRRWAKFAKYLAKKGFVIKVIAFIPNVKNSGNNWVNDIEHPNIEVFYLPSNYPEILNSSSGNIIIRFCKKIFTFLLKIFDGGIIQDKTIFFKRTLLKESSFLIKKFEIKNVICSGPYHRACYFTTLLKKDFSNLNVIIDFRDRWTDGQVYGIEKMSSRAFKKESTLQKFTCIHADFVISTYQEILDELKAEYRDLPSGKFIHFPHNYDLDDYTEFSENTTDLNSTRNKIKFIYGGTVNTAAFNDGFKPFFYSLSQLKHSGPSSVYNLIDISIYGENYNLNVLVNKLDISDAVKIYPKINEHKFYNLVSKSDFLLIFLGNDWKDLVTTKNITYLPFKKPIIVFSEKGKVSQMIVENELGYHFDSQNCFDNLINLVQNYQQGFLNYNTFFDYQEYSYDRASERLIDLFI